MAVGDNSYSTIIKNTTWSKSLGETMLFLNGLHFPLRSVSKHRELTVNHLQIIKPDLNCKYYCIVYTETTSKTNNGGLKDPRLSNMLTETVLKMQLHLIAYCIKNIYNFTQNQFIIIPFIFLQIRVVKAIPPISVPLLATIH